MILSAQTLARINKNSTGIIKPFLDRKIKTNGLTGGLSECGYDIHIDQEITLYPVSLKTLALRALSFNRPSFALASSVEEFKVPNHLMFSVMDKSTWARQGICVFNTVAEPGWCGILTLEIMNVGQKIITIKRYSPIAQVQFFTLDESTNIPYKGKYQSQEAGPQAARFD